MPRIGFDSDGTTPYVYIETQSGAGPTICSTAIGMDSTDTDKNIFKIATAPLPDVTPETATPNLSIDPTTDGDFTIRANGLGDINLISANITTTGGILQADITTGRITIASGGMGISTITGNDSVAVGPTAGNINLVTANSTVEFTGSGSTLTFDLTANSNLVLGSNLPFIAGGSSNTGFGPTVLGNITTGEFNTVMGYAAFISADTGSDNTAIGHNSMFSATSASNNTCVGDSSGYRIDSGSNNCFFGDGISGVSAAADNTLLGHAVASNHITGTLARNTIIGSTAGGAYSGFGNTITDNILINSQGVDSEANTLHIGAGTGVGHYQLQASYISGIDGINVGSVAKVVTMATGATDQLGTATITAGTGISVTPTANTITIAATGMGSFTWSVATTNTATAVNNGYFANSTSTISFTLPPLASVGDSVRISGLGTGGWTVVQNAGQTINVMGTTSTTTGASGSLSSTSQYDSVELVCCVANSMFNVVSITSNLAIV